MARNKFEKGDFVTWTNKPGSFGIYEGNNLSESSSYKRLTLALYFDPSKLIRLENGTYEEVEHIEIASDDKKCEKTLDTEYEDYWWHKLTPTQYENAISTLEKLGYRWDEENLELINIETQQVVKKIFIPKIEYNGEIIKPITKNLKDKLNNFVKTKNKNTTSYYPNYCYGQQYEEFWD